MRKIIMLSVIGLLICGSALAGYRINQYGNTAYYNDDNGDSGTATTYGNTTYYHGSDGSSGHCTQYGNQTYCN